jgi:glyoxylase-like metal-dependent hydrolase (beta-lactamase superfamily II)
MTNIEQTTADVFRVRTIMVNLYLVRSGSSWVLVDAGLRGFGQTIMKAAAEFTGTAAAPAAIVLTHAHFDHVGSLAALLERWDVPVYAHRLERPYLDGRSPYPPPDPLVGRGSMALLSRLYPRAPMNIGPRLRELPADGSVPGLDGWRWLHTPGHTPGHVALFREHDRTLLAGDALTTVQQESALAVATQRQELHGPPAYFTQDWQSSAGSVRALAELNPNILATGHGVPMHGTAMRAELDRLAADFERREVPRFGRYAKQPALADENGIVSLPPDPLPKVMASVAAAGVVLVLASRGSRARRIGGMELGSSRL